MNQGRKVIQIANLRFKNKSIRNQSISGTDGRQGREVKRCSIHFPEKRKSNYNPGRFPEIKVD